VLVLSETVLVNESRLDLRRFRSLIEADCGNLRINGSDIYTSTSTSTKNVVHRSRRRCSPEFFESWSPATSLTTAVLGWMFHGGR
jgi:hypothetical protein